MQGLTLQPMAFGEKDLSGHNVMSKILTPCSAPSNQPLHSTYQCHDRENRCEYQQRVLGVENAFIPLIFTTTGGMGDAATQFYKRLALVPALCAGSSPH